MDVHGFESVKLPTQMKMETWKVENWKVGKLFPSSQLLRERFLSGHGHGGAPRKRDSEFLCLPPKMASLEKTGRAQKGASMVMSH